MKPVNPLTIPYQVVKGEYEIERNEQIPNSYNKLGKISLI